MTVFIRVVEEGNFSAAARKLHMTPSAVSKLIGRLEDRLGAQLLARTTRNVGLTDEGRLYYQHCTPILAAIDEAEHAVSAFQDKPRGLLRITVPNSLGQYHILPMIAALMDRYPDLNIETILTNDVIDLVESHIDAAVRIGPQPDSALIARKLGSTRRIVVASPDYLAHHGTPKKPGELAKHNCIRQGMIPSMNQWEFLGPRGIEHMTVSGRLTVNNTPAMHQAALAGAGLIRVGDFIVGTDIKAGRLIRVLGDFESPNAVDIFVVYPPNRHLSPKVRAFVAFLAEHFLPDPPWEKAPRQSGA